jgi:hypothetical protein
MIHRQETILALLIASTGLVRCQPHGAREIYTFPILAQDLNGMALFAGRDATNLIDELCSQNSVLVSGAANIETGEFMTWQAYLNGPGRYGDPKYYNAIHPWETLWGACETIKPAST